VGKSRQIFLNCDNINRGEWINVKIPLMLNSDNKWTPANNHNPGSCRVSIILLTQNAVTPVCQSPKRLKAIISEQISNEIIVVHYDQDEDTDSDSDSNAEPGFNNNKKIDITRPTNEKGDEKVVHARAKGEFASAVMKGIELCNGQFILVMDADFPYPEEVLRELVKELLNSPNSIIIASRYAKGASRQKLPFGRSTISKGARMIVRHGLKVKDVQDPLSSCFALPTQLIENIRIEGKGNEILLEILVKVNNGKRNNNIPIKEIPFKQKDKQSTKKIDFNRIKSYSNAVWHLYRYGRKSNQLQNNSDVVEQKKHKSVLFLSKAGRFFTVGASGLVVNYVVSFLLSNVVSNIWYIQATLIGIIVSITTNFLLNKVWTFEDRDFSIRHFFKQYTLFLALCGLGAVIQLSLVFVFVEYSSIQYGLALIIAVCVSSLGNFLLNKKITFEEKIWE
jgi:dolichol-phosphate mannosyltransferase